MARSEADPLVIRVRRGALASPSPSPARAPDESESASASSTSSDEDEEQCERAAGAPVAAAVVRADEVLRWLSARLGPDRAEALLPHVRASMSAAGVGQARWPRMLNTGCP